MTANWRKDIIQAERTQIIKMLKTLSKEVVVYCKPRQIIFTEDAIKALEEKPI